MKRIINSFSKNLFDVCTILCVLLIYLINNKYLKIHTYGIIHDVCCNYLNDIICPIMLLAYCNIILPDGKKINRLGMMIVFLFLVGIFWEFVSPLYKSNAVADWWDIVCYLIGGMIYKFILWCKKE